MKKKSLQKIIKKNEIQPSHTEREMNDFCPYFGTCKERSFEWNCFGRYYKCQRYLTGDLTLPVAGYQTFLDMQKDKR